MDLGQVDVTNELSRLKGELMTAEEAINSGNLVKEVEDAFKEQAAMMKQTQQQLEQKLMRMQEEFGRKVDDVVRASDVFEMSLELDKGKGIKRRLEDEFETCSQLPVRGDQSQGAGQAAEPAGIQPEGTAGATGQGVAKLEAASPLTVVLDASAASTQEKVGGFRMPEAHGQTQI